LFPFNQSGDQFGQRFAQFPDSLLLVEPELSGTNDPLCELQLVEV